MRNGNGDGDGDGDGDGNGNADHIKKEVAGWRSRVHAVTSWNCLIVFMKSLTVCVYKYKYAMHPISTGIHHNRKQDVV